MYIDVACVTLPTVNVTLPTLRGMAAADREHWPFQLVVHEPAAPVLHDPVTVAFASGPCNASCNIRVTAAVHVLCCAAAEPSRSPTWRVGALTVTLAACAVAEPPLSATVSVTV